MPADALKCKECGTTYDLEARYVCERCFGPLEVAYDYAGLDVEETRRRIQAGPRTIWRYADFLPFVAERAAAGAADRLHPADPRRPARRRASGCARCGSRTTPPTRRTRSRTASSPSRRPRAGARLRRRWRAPRRATSPTRSPPTRPSDGPASPTSSSPRTSRSRRSSRPASTARKLVAVRGNYDDVNRLCTELSGEPAVGVRQRQHAPLLRRGLQDARLRDRRAARLRAAGPRRRADRLGLAVHQDRPRLRGVDRGRPARRRRARDERRAGRGLLARSRRRSPTATTSAARSSPTRSPSRWRSATRPTVRTRSTLARRTGGVDRRGHRRRDPRGHPPAGRDDRHLHRDGRRRDHRDAGQARGARRHRPRRARGARASPARA